MVETELKKELELKDLIFMGLGNIVGAGVFVILGRTVLFGGKFTIPAFLIVSFLSIVMGLVYLEIHNRYKSDITEYLAIKDTFGEKIGKISLYIIYLFAVFSAVTITIAMTKYISNHGYFTNIFNNRKWLEIVFSIILISLMCYINYRGIETSKIVANTIGIAMLIVLSGIVLLGTKHFHIKKIMNGPKVEWNSFLLATILALFLFNGYDLIIKMNNETKNPEDTSKALIGTIGLTTIIYLLILIGCLSVLGYKKMTKSYHPLSEIYEFLVNKKVAIISYILGIFIMFNTAFLSLLSGTRFMYGLGKDKEIHYSDFWTTLSKYQTPKNAILFTFILAICLTLINNEVTMTIFTNTSVLFILLLIACSILIIRWRERNEKEKEKHNFIPGNIKNIPVVVILSIIILIYMKYMIIKNKFFI
jgi:APA family basic amino acid/polyamine antiporter